MKNALVSLSNIVCDALEMGMSVDLAELGNLRVSVRPLSPQEKGGTLVFQSGNNGKCCVLKKEKTV